MNKFILLACALALPASPAPAKSLLKRFAGEVGQSVAQSASRGVNRGSQGVTGSDLMGVARTLAEAGRQSGGVNQGSQAVVGSLGAGGSGSFQRYGNWEFRVEKLEVGPDEQWQAVIGVRNAADYRQGMVASEIKMFLIDADGETLANWGEIYKAGIEGSSSGLEPVSGTLWLEKGDQTRVRLRFDGSRNFKPAKIRLQSTGATAQTRLFPAN